MRRILLLPLFAAACDGSAPTGPLDPASLPGDLAAISIEAEGTPTYPLTMLEITENGPDSAGFNGFVIVDAQARVMWYYRTDGGPTGAAQMSNGNLALIDTGRGLLEVTPDGDVVAEVPHEEGSREVHHDVVSATDGSLLLLATDWREVNGEPIAGDAVWQWWPETGALEKRWTAFDHLDPKTDWAPRSHAADWLHTNSLAVGPRGNFVLSFRSLNQVISVAPSGALEWRLGGDHATITVPPEGRFSGQHTASEIAPNRVLMFDNGLDRTDDRYSRALELAIDPATGAAEVAWQWRPERDNWARALSLARRLPNGNTFVVFGLTEGLIESTGPVEAYEVTAEGDVVWHLVVHGVLGMYRAWPVMDDAAFR